MRKKQQKQLYADIPQNRCSYKFPKFHRKIPVLESPFNKVARLKTCSFIKKIPQHRCFPVKFAKFLRTPSVATSETANLLHIRVGNLDWCKCGHCKNEAREIDCLCFIEVNPMLIASAKFGKQILWVIAWLLLTRIDFIYLGDEFFFLFLV